MMVLFVANVVGKDRVIKIYKIVFLVILESQTADQET